MADSLTFKDDISDGGKEIWKWEKKVDLLFTWCSALAAVTTKAPSLAVETAWLTMASYCASFLYQYLRLPLIKTLHIIEIPFIVVASYLSTYASISKIRKHMHFIFITLVIHEPVLPLRYMMHPPPNDTSGSELSPRQIEILITIERTGAGLSMVAIALTLLSFFLFKRLRTTPNIFIILASIANAGASIASMIGYDGLDKGEESTLCQGQGFIFEWWVVDFVTMAYRSRMNNEFGHLGSCNRIHGGRLPWLSTSSSSSSTTPIPPFFGNASGSTV